MGPCRWEVDGLDATPHVMIARRAAVFELPVPSRQC